MDAEREAIDVINVQEHIESKDDDVDPTTDESIKVEGI